MRFLITIVLCTLFFVGCQSLPDAPDIPDVPITPIPPVEKGTRLCVIGDGGTGSSDQYHVARALEGENCNAILYVGDVIYERGITSPTDEDFYSKFYKPYKKLIEEQKVTFYMSMGNHDWYWPGDGKHWLKIAQTYDKIYYPGYGYYTKIGNTCLLQIETNEEDNREKIEDWWKKEKQTDFWKDCKFTVGFGHNPYYSAGKHGHASGDTKEFLEDTVIGAVDLYVAGHDHNLADEGTVKGTRLFISGCAGKKRDLDKKPNGGWGVGDEVGYLVLDIVDHEAQFKFVTVKKDNITPVYRGKLLGVGLRK
jgi:hypothetical protein